MGSRALSHAWLEGGRGPGRVRFGTVGIAGRGAGAGGAAHRSPPSSSAIPSTVLLSLFPGFVRGARAVGRASCWHYPSMLPVRWLSLLALQAARRLPAHPGSCCPSARPIACLHFHSWQPITSLYWRSMH